MRILGAAVKFSRQLRGISHAPGFFSAKAAAAPLVEDKSFGENVQQAFVGVKAQVCEDLNLLPNHELK